MLDVNFFDKTWEVEYISARVKRVLEFVWNGNNEAAIDCLKMIQEKAKAAEKLLREK